MSKNNDFMSSRCGLRSMHGGVVSFGAAVCEKRLLKIARRDLIELLCQIRLRLVSEERRGVLNRSNLIDDGFANFGIVVTHAHGQYAAETIQVLIVLIVPDMEAFSTH